MSEQWYPATHDDAARQATAQERAAAALEQIASGGVYNIDSTYAAMLDGTNTTRIFRQWWAATNGSTDSRYKRLCRFFNMMAVAYGDKQYTLRYNLPGTSSEAAMTAQDDLAGKSAAILATDTTPGSTDWAEEDCMTWYVRANAISLADGTMNVLYVEGEDGFDLGGDLAPVYTFSPALWKREWSDGSYNYKSFRMTGHGNYRPWAGDVAPDNTKRPMTWHPTFTGSLDSQGRLTSGAGKVPYNNASASTGLTKAHLRNNYEGLWCDCDTEWALDVWQLRHFNLENSGILEGCTTYNYDYTPALAETGVERVLVTTTQAATLVVGSTVTLSTTARGGTATFSMKRIRKIETVTIEETSYGAVYIDNGGTTFDVTTDLHFCTMPWYSGSTEALPGHKDGCIGSLTAGKTPIRVNGVEFMIGAYELGLDPLYNVTAGSDGTHKNYAVYQCRNSEKLASSITSDYEATGITYTDMAQGWNYVKAFIRNVLGVVFPETVGGSSTGWLKSAFYGAGSAGVRCPWRFGNLNNEGFAGLACGNGYNDPGNASWHGVPRLGGAGKKRGEWPAA